MPYAFASDFPHEAEVTAHMESMMVDLGCIETVKIQRADLLTTQYNNGIMFVWNPQGGCFSDLGVSNANFGLGDHGEKVTWQVISLDPDCDGSGEATVHHEVLHALGVHHEHVRPDRDTYISVNMDNTDAGAHNFEKIDENQWETTDLGDTTNNFELASVMTYC